MRQLGTYFLLELKRSVRMLPWFLGSILLLLLALTAGIFGITRFMQQAQIFDTVTVGLVIPEEESQAKLITQVLSNMESVKSICRFQYTTLQEAEDLLVEGELQAAVVLSENFYHDMNTGVNTPAVILIPKDSTLNLMVFQELLRDGVSLIQTTEAGVYAADDAWRAYETSLSHGELEDLIFLRYIESAFYRDQVFQQRLVSATGEVQMLEYYFVSGLLILLLMFGLNLGFLYEKQEQVIADKLRVYGLGPARISLIRLVVMTLLLWLLFLFLLFLSGIVCRIAGAQMFLLDGATVFGGLMLCGSIGALFHVIYANAGTMGTMLLFFVNAGMILLGGLILPVSYLPKLLRGLQRVLPVCFWQNFALELLFGQPEFSQVIPLVGILGLGILLGSISGLKILKGPARSLGTGCK